MVLKNLLQNFGDARVARGGINISTKADTRLNCHEANTNVWRKTPYRDIVIPKNHVMYNNADIFPLQLNATSRPKPQCDRDDIILPNYQYIDEEDFLPLKIPDKEDDSYLACLIEHLRDSKHTQSQLKEARKFKGGWEGWAQTEMAIALQRKYEGQTKTWRKQAVYDECPWAPQPKEVDLWVDVEPRDARNGIAWFGGVEMKCEDAGVRRSTTTKFASQVISDIGAIKQGIKTDLYPKWEKHRCASKYSRADQRQPSTAKPATPHRDGRWAWQDDQDTWLQSFENQLYEGTGLWGKKIGTVMYSIGITGYPDSLLASHWSDAKAADVGYCPLDRTSCDALLQRDFQRWKRFDESRRDRGACGNMIADEDFEWKHVYVVWWKRVFLDGTASSSSSGADHECGQRPRRTDPEYEIEKRLERWERVKKSIYEIIPEDHLSALLPPSPSSSAASDPVRDYLRPETSDELELIDRLTFSAKLADQVADNLFIFSLYSLVPLTATTPPVTPAATDHHDDDNDVSEEDLDDYFLPRLKW